MMQRLSCLFYGFLKIAANAQRLGLGMIRVAILIIFVGSVDLNSGITKPKASCLSWRTVPS